MKWIIFIAILIVALGALILATKQRHEFLASGASPNNSIIFWLTQ